MGENTAIEWADHTFNPVIGCQKVSAACDFCYAETLMDTRLGRVEWGPHGERKRTSESNWRQPLAWNRKAEAEGVRRRVFCASLADVFDNRWPAGARDDLWNLIRETPHLTWMLLTKRPQNIESMRPAGPSWPLNVWLGITAENQDEYERRWPYLEREDVERTFISYEPALGPLRNLLLSGRTMPDWIICGGESGAGARPMYPAWARTIRDECQATGIAFFFKQWGEWLPQNDDWENPKAKCWADGDGLPRDWRDRPNSYLCMKSDGERTSGYTGDALFFKRLGKKRAGRLLDGREWNEMPA